jgi:hypothetical protein
MAIILRDNSRYTDRTPLSDPNLILPDLIILGNNWCTVQTIGGVRSTRGLGPTMTARGQSIGISNGMLPQTLIMSRLGQLSRLGARI